MDENFLESFLDTLEEYTEAINDLREKAKHCEYDRSYFLHREYERVKEVKEKISKSLVGIIDERVKIILKQNENAT